MAKTLLSKIGDFYIKREDQNPTGSAKDRALSVQVQRLADEHITRAVISSTGNAAISAAHYCSLNHIDLTVFVSPKINPHKKALLNHTKLVTSLNPIKDAFVFSKANGAFFLRQSTDPTALLGYQEIGRELLEQLPQMTSLFVPVGSGTTFLGIRQAIPPAIPMFAVQPAFYCPIASHFDKKFTAESTSITDALSVKYLPLKPRLLPLITNAFVLQNQQILDASAILEANNIITSNEGALSLAGLFKARELHQNVGNYPVILLTGAKR
ncbi:PLP-dependent lyase/thiolase [Patescibacteria group bacterium]|nr:PLP-dependent lyase/thiolase [Patescibacteria group bacterium]